MSFIQCPECGCKISSTARQCPNCGFVSNNPLLPISSQTQNFLVPSFKCDVLYIDSATIERNAICSARDNKIIYDTFGNIESLRKIAPSFAQTIESLAEQENVLVAKIPEYINKLIDSGMYKINTDKNGEILASIVDSCSNKIVHQIRLERKVFASSPELLNSLNNVAIQSQMNNVIKEIESLADSISQISLELENDRLALVDSSYSQLKQASQIEDTKLRQSALLNIINTSNNAMCRLQREYKIQYAKIDEENNKDAITLFFQSKHKDNERQMIYKKTFNSLYFILNSLQIQCCAYSILGEPRAERECLKEFNKFIIENHLNKKDVLLNINSGLECRNSKLVDGFLNISQSIMQIGYSETKNHDTIYLPGNNI